MFDVLFLKYLNCYFLLWMLCFVVFVFVLFIVVCLSVVCVDVLIDLCVFCDVGVLFDVLSDDVVWYVVVFWDDNYYVCVFGMLIGCVMMVMMIVELFVVFCDLFVEFVEVNVMMLMFDEDVWSWRGVVVRRRATL